MKRVLCFLLCGILVFATKSVLAADRYWVASANSSWHNPASWSSTNGGPGGSTIPGTADRAIFNGNSNATCTISNAINVSEILIDATFAGTISQAGASITSKYINQAGGTFQGGNAPITATSYLRLTGGTFLSTSGTLTLGPGANNFGTNLFQHNNGTVTFTAGGTLGGTPVFYDLIFSENVITTRTFTIGGPVTVVNDLQIAGTGSILLNTGTIQIMGNLICANTGTGGGTALLSFQGSGNQTISGSSAINVNKLPRVEINKPAGTLFLTNTITFSNDFSNVTGNLNSGTARVVFSNGNGGAFGTGTSLDITGNTTFNNLEISPAAALTMAINASTILTTNNFTYSGSSAALLNGGTISIKGNLNVTNTSLSAKLGTTVLSIDGTANQLFTGSSTEKTGTLPEIKINKPSGTLTLDKLINLRGNWTYQQGNINPGTSTLVVTGTLKFTGSHSLNNLAYSCLSTSSITTDAATILTVNNLYLNGAARTTLNTGTINILGNIYDSNTATLGGGTTVLAFTGSTNQNIYHTSGQEEGSLPIVSINKTGGDLILPDYISVRGGWRYLTGNIDYSTNNSTVIFGTGALTISGSHSLNNVTFSSATKSTYTLSTNTVLTVKGKLTLSGTAALTLNGWKINAEKDVIVNNSFNGGGGSSTIAFTGTGTQTLQGTAAPNQGILPTILINKPSGTLQLQDNISLAANWNLQNGTVDAGTSTLIFSGTNIQFFGDQTVYNLIFNPSTTGNKNFYLTGGTKVTVENDLTLSGVAGSNILLNTGQLDIKGDITITNTGLTSGGTASISLTGASDQTITGSGIAGAGSISKLQINKTSGTVIISNIPTVSNTLTMTEGNIDLRGSELVLGSGSTNLGTLSHSSGRVYNGTFTRWYGTNGVADSTDASFFPFGTEQEERPIYVSTISRPTTAGTISVFHDPTSGNVPADMIDNGSFVRSYSNAFWQIVSKGITGGTYKVRAGGEGFGATNLQDLRLVVAGGTPGTHDASTGTISSPSVTRTNLTLADLNNSFRMGSSQPAEPLPVQLLSFSAEKESNIVALRWVTVTETNNNYFTIERSVNGREFIAIGQLEGAGTTSERQYYRFIDKTPLNGISYYRLVQQDVDGRKTYSKTVSVKFEVMNSTAAISVFPNPAADFARVKSIGLSGASTLEIIDLTGKALIKAPVLSEITELNISGLPKGIYQVRLINEGQATTTKLIKQ